MKKRLFTFFFIGILHQVSAQESLIDTVLIDNQFSKVSKTAKISNLNSDKILENSTSLSDLLRFQPNIYIKENGRGATSSPSFRGTTAQQTAFVWNGINVNSQFLGQGDINNISVLGSDEVAVKYGGGSVLYGSGAIGGSVHFNNILKYNKAWNSQLFAEYASYNTINTLLKTSYSNEFVSMQFSFARQQSDNDYEVKEKYYLNRNAAYQNSTFNLGIAYKLSPKDELYWQTQIFDSEQNYALLSEFSTPTKYRSQTFRSLIGWRSKTGNLENDIKLAYLTDDYQYYMNSNIPDSKSGGGTKQYLVKNDISYKLTTRSSLNAILEYDHITAESFNTSRMPANRNQGSVALLYRNSQVKNLFFEAGTKKDFVDDFKSPYLFSAGAQYLPISWYEMKFNVSKNFRAPSFNDLYWNPGGNPDLKAETSYQTELSQILKWKKWSVSVTPYYINVRDMIRWIPNSAGIYTATNTEKVESLGLEAKLGYNYDNGNHHLKVQASYAYSQSTDEKLKKQLPYVPFHTFGGSSSYRHNRFELFLQGIWNGKTFSDSEESEKLALDAFAVINAGVYVEIVKGTKIGIKANNLTNKIYRTVYGYYMPKSNFAINMNLNF